MVCQFVPIYKIQLEGSFYQMLFSPLTADTANICWRWDMIKFSRNYWWYRIYRAMWKKFSDNCDNWNRGGNWMECGEIGNYRKCFHMIQSVCDGPTTGWVSVTLPCGHTELSSLQSYFSFISSWLIPKWKDWHIDMSIKVFKLSTNFNILLSRWWKVFRKDWFGWMPFHQRNYLKLACSSTVLGRYGNCWIMWDWLQVAAKRSAVNQIRGPDETNYTLHFLLAFAFQEQHKHRIFSFPNSALSLATLCKG